MKLQWVRNEYLTEGHPSNKNYKFGVRFIKNMKYSDLWLKEEGDFKKWKDALSQVCLQSDFHSKFSAIKMIGKGSFARVYLVEEKEKKTRFAVKAFSKDYLLSQNKGKVNISYIIHKYSGQKSIGG
jgi:serine/threonine protein kinase